MIFRLICGHHLSGNLINKFAGDVLAQVTRGGVIESLHLGHLIVKGVRGMKKSIKELKKGNN